VYLPEDDLRIETCWSDFKCFIVKFYVSALVGVIIKVILQNARCNNEDNFAQFVYNTTNTVRNDTIVNQVKQFLFTPELPDRVRSPRYFLLNGYRVSFPEGGGGRLECTLHQRLVSHARAKNAWSCTSGPLTCLHGVDRDRFTFFCCSIIKKKDYFLKFVKKYTPLMVKAYN